MKMFWSVKESRCGQRGEMPTIGQLSIHIGDTIVEVDTLTSTVTPVIFPQ